MVGLEDERVGLARLVRDQSGDLPQVRGEDDGARAAPKEEADGIARVVRDGEGFHVEIAHRETFAGAKDAPIDPRRRARAVAERLGNRPLGLAIGVNRQIMARGKDSERRDVVVMLVGNHDPVEVGGGTVRGREMLLDLTRAQTGVHEQTRARSFEQGAVALAPAGEDREAHRNVHYATSKISNAKRKTPRKWSNGAIGKPSLRLRLPRSPAIVFATVFMSTPTLQQIQKIGLQQVLSPRMQQSLRILQAPSLDLDAMVRQELESNPVLEEAPRSEEDSSEETAAEGPSLPDDLEAIAQLDDEWREYFNQAAATAPRTDAETEERRQAFFDSITRPETLQEHLLAQIGLEDADDALRPVCEQIIGNLDERGYLSAGEEELLGWAGGNRAIAGRALAMVQSFDPVGVGARDLRECLALQLARLGHGAESAAARIARAHLEDLAERRFAAIAGALGLRVEDVQRAAGVIATLDPSPGGRFAANDARFIVPDLAVQKDGDAWVVLQNDDALPRLRIGNAYKDLLGETGQSREVRDYIHARIRSAKFFIQSIHQRQRTILRIAQEIVRIQRDFLEHGRERLRPLTMAEMAKRLGVHETTVGRAVSGKFMRTPHGVFELKWFFTPGVKTPHGDAISVARVKAAISGLIGDESPDRPLSDQEIAAALDRRGMPIARRTVAKYREELGLLPSHDRKRGAAT